jgi:hypothetical protein
MSVTDAQVKAARSAWYREWNVDEPTDPEVLDVDTEAWRAALEAAEREAWRPIEEAPREIGKLVDLWVVQRLIVNGETHTSRAERYVNARFGDWSTGIGRWMDFGGNDIEYSATETDEGDTITDERRVTHFRPLPSSPEQS